MKSKNVTIWVIAIAAMLMLLGPLAGQSRGDFVLTGDQQLTVDSSHSNVPSIGTLRDWSRAYIVPGGYVTRLLAHDSSTVDILGGSVGDCFLAYNSSIVNISGGWVESLYARDYSTVNVSGGSVLSFRAYNSSIVNISGGSVIFLGAWDSSDVNMSGGYVHFLDAWGSSVVSFYGQNFSVSGGLILDGNRVLGTGILSGEWFDGTSWATNIYYNDPTATILAIPEPATLLLLGFGAVMMRKKRTYSLD